MSIWMVLQLTQPTSGGAVTVVINYCANCVETLGSRFTVYFGKLAMRTRWRAGAAPH